MYVYKNVFYAVYAMMVSMQLHLLTIWGGFEEVGMFLAI